MSSEEIVRQGDPEEIIRRKDWYRLTTTGVEFLRDPTIEEYNEFVTGVLYPMEKALRWWWGDILNKGEQVHGEMYTQALDDSGYKYQTLANAKSVAGKIPREYVDVETGEIISLRRDDLSFSAHQTLAKYNKHDSPEELRRLKRWIDFAADHGLSQRKTLTLTKVFDEPSTVPENPAQAQALKDAEIDFDRSLVAGDVEVIETEDEATEDDAPLRHAEPLVRDLQKRVREWENVAAETTEELQETTEELEETRESLEDHRWAITDILTCRRALWARAWIRERRRRREAESRLVELERRLDLLEGNQ